LPCMNGEYGSSLFSRCPSQRTDRSARCVFDHAHRHRFNDIAKLRVAERRVAERVCCGTIHGTGWDGTGRGVACGVTKAKAMPMPLALALALASVVADANAFGMITPIETEPVIAAAGSYALGIERLALSLVDGLPSIKNGRHPCGYRPFFSTDVRPAYSPASSLSLRVSLRCCVFQLLQRACLDAHACRLRREPTVFA
jgi:hypothetical protein